MSEAQTYEKPYFDQYLESVTVNKTGRGNRKVKQVILVFED